MEERQLRGKIEEQLVKKAFEGDVSAFNELYMYLRVPIYNFAYRMLNISTAAEDITKRPLSFLSNIQINIKRSAGVSKPFYAASQETEYYITFGSVRELLKCSGTRNTIVVR